MTTNESDRGPGTPLRILTKDEMRDGLNLLATQVLASRAIDIAQERLKRVANDVLTTVETDNRRLAERLLASGRPAYVTIDGVDGIVRQMPDGTRNIVNIINGLAIVGKGLPPAGEAGE